MTKVKEGNPADQDPTKEKEVEDPAPENDPAKKDDKVSYETYQKVLKEKKAAAARIAEMEKANKEREDADLKAKEDYKKLAESREQELKEANEKLTTFQKREQDLKKYVAFRSNLSGELKDKFSSLVDLDQVIIDPDTGEVDVNSAKRAAKQFETEWPEALEKKAAAKLPTDAAKGGAGKLSYAEWLEIKDLSEQKKRRKDVDPNTVS